MNSNKIIAISVLVLTSLISSQSIAALVDFDDLVANTSYSVGSSFSSGGINVGIQDFTFASGISFSGGAAIVDDSSISGGMGNDIAVNNVLLDFNVGTASRIDLLFGEFGGNLNIAINNEFHNFENFTEIDGTTIGGVFVAIVNGLGNDQGSLSLFGTIDSFALGGQELWIDDLNITTPVPLPAGIILLSLGVSGLAAFARKRA